jgi:hypothetical protein
MACINKTIAAYLWKTTSWLKNKEIGITKSLRIRLIKVKIEKRFRSGVYQTSKVKWTWINDKKC